MPESTSELAVQLTEALRGLRADRPETIETLRPLYDDDVSFRDPIQTASGIEPFMALNRRLLGRCKEIAFSPKSVATAGDDLFLTWSMHARPHLGPRIHVEGVTHAQARRGRVLVHRDYWDLGELVTSPVPFAHKALQWVLKPLA